MTTPITHSTQCKRCRRAGEKLFLKGDRCNSAKCAIVKRNFPPGVHGSVKGQPKLTNYGQQLKAKQKAKRIYGLMEKQFRNYFEKAVAKVGNTGESMFKILELRLDNTIYRLGLASSRNLANQVVGHGHVLVNGKKVDIPSYQVKTGDIISIKKSSLESPIFKNLSDKLANKEKKEAMAPWLSLNEKVLEGKVTSSPKLGDMEMGIDWQMIVEFYSK